MNGEPVTRLDGMLVELDQRFPGLIETAFRRYRDFAGKEPPTEPRAFAAYSTACRAALAHLEKLLKLALSLNGERAAAPSDDVDRLIADAEAALKKTGPLSDNRQ